MFDLFTSHIDEERSTSVPDNSDAASTVTSFSDVSSLLDAPVPQQPDMPERLARRRSSISGIGLSDERIARQQRSLLELMDRLRSFGVQFELDLPQIAAVGPQNAGANATGHLRARVYDFLPPGKSSLIEGICGIRLPRASGTCTRCPLELRMKHSSGTWRCDVSLQFIYDEGGLLLGQARTIDFGSAIFKPHEVEDRVKRAQRAILSPSVPPRDFLQGTVPGTTELTFSKNYISIQIQGPDVSDLSFVDLPGLIASARQGKSTDISLIEDLVTSYIQKQSTLILLTVACEADFETQGAHQLVKKHDPDGTRTIGAIKIIFHELTSAEAVYEGVLTKPDRIAKGDEDHWVRFIKNDEEQLDLGWFSVKQPDAIQLQKGLSWEQARESEAEWFRSTKPWSLLPAKYSKNLGTMNLVARLGETLANLIARRLPELREELEDVLQHTEEDFKDLPVPLSEDSLAEMMRLITAFCADVSRHSEGVPANEGLLQSINAKQAEFKRSILSLAPEFRPYKHSESVADLPQLPPCEFLDGEGEDRTVSGSGLTMHIDEVMDLMKQSRTRELPDYYPYEVPKHIIEHSTKKWGSVVFAYFDDVLAIVHGHYKQLIEEHFKHFESGGLLSAVQMEVHTQIKRHREETRERLKWLLQLESRPFTLNDRYLAEFKSKFLAYYKMYRHNVLNHTPVTYIQTFNSGRSTNYVSEVMSSLSKMNIKDVKASDLAKLLPEDEFEPALDLMAVVSAYYQVSCKRFIDFVPVVVDYDFVLGLSRNLQTALYSAIIKDDARSRCKNLLQESPSVAARRSKLQRRYERLEAARNELLSMRWREM